MFTLDPEKHLTRPLGCVCFRRNQQVARKPKPCFAVAHVTEVQLGSVSCSSSTGHIFLPSAPQRTPTLKTRVCCLPSRELCQRLFFFFFGGRHPVEIKMQMKVLWSILLLLAVTPSVLSQSGTAPLVSSAIALIVLNGSPEVSHLLSLLLS